MRGGACWAAAGNGAPEATPAGPVSEEKLGWGDLFMSKQNRTAVFGKLQRVLKKAYPAPEFSTHSVLEHLLFATLLEDAHYDLAERSFSTLIKSYYDLNEIRVTSNRELAEVLHLLPEPERAARRFRGVLQQVFESSYKFDLEHLLKQNIGAAEKTLREFPSVTPFAADFVVQVALDGHAIPLDEGALTALYVVGAISGAEREERKATGLARAIPKAKGREFAFGLHEFGADFVSHPHSPHVRELALSIDADCKDRLPKRGVKQDEAARRATAAAAAEASAKENSPGIPTATAGAKVSPPATPSGGSSKKGKLPESSPEPVGKQPQAASDHQPATPVREAAAKGTDAPSSGGKTKGVAPPAQKPAEKKPVAEAAGAEKSPANKPSDKKPASVKPEGQKVTEVKSSTAASKPAPAKERPAGEQKSEAEKVPTKLGGAAAELPGVKKTAVTPAEGTSAAAKTGDVKRAGPSTKQAEVTKPADHKLPSDGKATSAGKSPSETKGGAAKGEGQSKPAPAAKALPASHSNSEIKPAAGAKPAASGSQPASPKSGGKPVPSGKGTSTDKGTETVKSDKSAKAETPAKAKVDPPKSEKSVDPPKSGSAKNKPLAARAADSREPKRKPK